MFSDECQKRVAMCERNVQSPIIEGCFSVLSRHFRIFLGREETISIGDLKIKMTIPVIYGLIVAL